MKIIGKLKCWAGGHKRGKFLRVDRTAIGETFTVYACPRCGRETRYKAKDAPLAPNGGAPGDRHDNIA